jgi:hypothetical protein
MYFLRGASTVAVVVAETAKAVWDCLHSRFMPVPTQQKWREVSQRYQELWNLPNCMGAIDGKHIRVKCPPNSGSYFYNYKGYFSIVLLACADADGLFLTIDVGDFGRNSDGRIFKRSALGQGILNNSLNIPGPEALPRWEDKPPFPHYFVGDEAFPLHRNVMRPYPKRVLNDEKRVFNYRLSRGRRSVECAFGMLTSKFRIFEQPICCKPDTVDNIIKAACVLHNFIRIREGHYSSSSENLSHDSTTRQSWTQLQANTRRSTRDAIELRDTLCSYFNSPQGEVPWQLNHL